MFINVSTVTDYNTNASIETLCGWNFDWGKIYTPKYDIYSNILYIEEKML